MYIFEGWYTDSALTQKYDFTNATIEGNLTLYAKYEAIPVTEEVVRIKVEAQPTIRYNETLDLSNITLYLETSTGKTIETTLSNPECQVTYVNTYLGTQRATVKYKDLTTTFNLTVVDYLTGITVENNGKKEYNLGETIDTSSVVVRTVMASGLAGEIVVPDSITPTVATAVGPLRINVTYKEYTAAFYVTVKGAKIEYIENSKLQGELPDGYETTNFVTVLWSGDYKATYTLNGGSPIAITSGTELRKPGKYVLTVGEGAEAVQKQFTIKADLPDYTLVEENGKYILTFNKPEQIGEVLIYAELENGDIIEGDIRELSGGTLKQTYTFENPGYYYLEITAGGNSKPAEFII